MLFLVDESAGEIPLAGERIDPPTREQDAPMIVQAHRARGRLRARVDAEAALAAFDQAAAGLDLGSAARAVLPLIELAHVRNNRAVPRFATATVTELARIGLFQELSGEVLTKLAHHMRRADVAPGDPIVLEGEEGDHFYVILRGLVAVSNQGGLGPRRMLRPGDYFGEVALTMHVPRTASVTALVPTTLASCDKETFDEYVRPLFADDDLAPPGGSAEDV
jgi:hypothetical protein